MDNQIEKRKKEDYPFPTAEELKEQLPEGDPTRLYLDEIGHLALLSEEEEQALARQMMDGNEEAREKLVEHNLLRAAFISMQYRGRGMHILDIMQEGNNGLLKAAGEYREIDKYPFFAFAAWHIHLAIDRAFKMSTIERRYPFVYERIDSERVLKNPGIFRQYMEMPRSRFVDDMDWSLITLIFGLNGGRKLTKQEILDMTGFSDDRLLSVSRQVLRAGIAPRRRRIRDYYEGKSENEE